MSENYCNAFPCNLVATINAVNNTLMVTAAAPIVGSFRILVDSELMWVSSGGTTQTWNVVRGIEGTTAAGHLQGAAVTVVLTAGSIAAILPSNLIGTYANFQNNYATKTPAAGTRYNCTDSIYDFIFDGTSWVPKGPIPGMVPINPAQWTLTTSGSDWIGSSTFNGGVWSAVVSNSFSTSITLNAALPPFPYTVLIYFTATLFANNYNAAGLTFINTSNMYNYSFNYMWNSGLGGSAIVTQHFNSGGFQSESAHCNTVGYQGGIQCFKLTNDGTSRTYWWGSGPQKPSPVMGVAGTDWCTPNQLQYAITTGGPNTDVTGQLLSFQIFNSIVA